MPTSTSPEAEAQLLRELQDILLRQDREQLHSVQEIMDSRELLSERVDPIIERHLDLLKQHFPVEFERAVEKIIDRKIEDSQERILNVIYPKLGTMISKYIQHQFQQLKESLEQQLDKTLSTGVIGRIRYAFFGLKKRDKETIITELDPPVIEEIFLIEQHSGVLLGNATRQDTVDDDMIAGMLTAIKGFVEDAFQQQNQQLEVISYGTYSIQIENQFNYYFAAVVSGSISAAQRGALSEQIGAFATSFFNTFTDGLPDREILDAQLQNHFFEDTSDS